MVITKSISELKQEGSHGTNETAPLLNDNGAVGINYHTEIKQERVGQIRIL